MLNFVLGAILCLCLGYIGIAIKGVYKARVRYFEDYCSFLDELIEEISFYKSPIGKFVESVTEYKRKEFRHTLMGYKCSVGENKEFVLESPILKKRDAEIIQNCFNSIGRTDSATQIFNLKNSKIHAEEMLKRANADLKSKGELYGKLGILFGIAVMILVI